MLVVADEFAFGVGRECGLSCAGEAEEDGGGSLVHVGVGRAVHRCDAPERVEVVHHGEHALLHLAAVPGVDDHLLALLDVEGHHGLGMEAEFPVVLAFGLGGVEHHEVGLEVLELLLCGADEHIGHEVSLPCHFHDEAHAEACGGVGSAENIYHVEGFVAELLHRFLAQPVPYLGRDGLVVVLIAVGGPPYRILRHLVLYKVFVLRGTAGVFACEYVHGAECGQIPLLVAFEARVEFCLIEIVVRWIVDDSGHILDPVPGKIQCCHLIYFWVKLFMPWQRP